MPVGEWIISLEEIEENMYLVTLSACGNIDHDENPYDSIVDGNRVDTEVSEASTIKKCQEIVCSYIQNNNLGAGNWNGGKVFKDNKQVGYISYNGRYWKKGSKYYS